MPLLNKKDEAFRERVLYGPIWRPILEVGIPIALFEAINHIFSIIDTLMASHISSDAVSTVVYLVQFNNFVGAIGSGLSVGGSILISQEFGRGNFERVKKLVSTVIFIISILTLAVFAISPFTRFILKVTGTPEEFIRLGAFYFSITMIAQGVKYLNNIFLSIEKIRGRSKTILVLNMAQVAIKLSLTAIYVYILNGNIANIAFATLISYTAVFAFCLVNTIVRRDVFTFSFKAIDLNKSQLKPLFRLSLPSMAEKMCFAYGKGTVNKMASDYGTDAVGAAGISNNMSGLLTGWQSGFQDSSSTIVGQVYGAGDLERVNKIFIRVTLLQLSIGIIGSVIFHFLSLPIARFFALSREGLNSEFENMIISVFNMELMGVTLLSLSYAATSLLLGMGKTKWVLVINIFRSFLLRVPILFFLQRILKIEFPAIGMSVALSNSISGVLAFFVAYYAIRKERKKAPIKETINA